MNRKIDVTKYGTSNKKVVHPYPCPKCESVATEKIEGKWQCNRCKYKGRGFVPMYRRIYDPSSDGIRTSLSSIGTYRRLPKI